MLLSSSITILLFAFCTSASRHGDGTDEDIDPTVQDGGRGPAKALQRRQAPWYLPQAFPNLVYYPNFREAWRYQPCRPYPEPAPPSYPYPPSTQPSSPSDDPNDILDRMGGGNMRGRSPEKEEPSRCVWAVVACCSPGSRDIRYSCFELLGCPGAFWDVNPCDDKVVMAAANSALNFYSDKNNVTSTS